MMTGLSAIVIRRPGFVERWFRLLSAKLRDKLDPTGHHVEETMRRLEHEMSMFDKLFPPPPIESRPPR